MGTKMGHGNGAALVRDAYPRHILFEKVDGLYYLRGKDLARAREAIALECDNTSGIGFDSITLSLYIRQLLAKGLPVAILQGNTVQAIKLQNRKTSCKVPSTTIGLAPKLLLGQRELERLERRYAGRKSSFRESVQKLQKDLSPTMGMSLTDMGDFYVYQVDIDMYEVDWELTTITPAGFEAVALAIHQAGQLLSCRLVAPKARRGKNGRMPKVTISVTEPLTYGQLSFPL